MKLTTVALEGFRASATDACPYINTSINSDAWHVGRWLQTTGRSAPRNAETSRGHRIRANDMLLSVNSRGEVTRIE